MKGQLIPSSERVKLLGMTIGNKLKFEMNKSELCKKDSQKSKCSGKIIVIFRQSKSKQLLNSMTISNFSYSPLIWLFSSIVT